METETLGDQVGKALNSISGTLTETQTATAVNPIMSGFLQIEGIIREGVIFTNSLGVPIESRDYINALLFYLQNNPFPQNVKPRDGSFQFVPKNPLDKYLKKSL